MTSVILAAIFAGLISGLISPFILSLLQHKYVWSRQKKHDLKYSILEDATKALAAFEADALDPGLQSNKKSYAGLVYDVEIRPETSALMEKTRGLIRTFYSAKTYEAFNDALTSTVSIENSPNMEFEEKRIEAIKRMCDELGIR